MTKIEIEKKLREEGVRVDSYSLNGGLPNEAYCLNRTESGREVYYSERGNKMGLKVFDNESDACDYLFKLLVKKDGF